MYRYDEDKRNLALQGERYYAAGAILYGKHWHEKPCEKCASKHQELFPVLFSTFAFSAELFLKALILDDGKIAAMKLRNHDLHMLFRLLPSNQQSELLEDQGLRQVLQVIDHEEEIDGDKAIFMKNPDQITDNDIEQAIESHANLFVYTRYLDKSTDDQFQVAFMDFFCRKLKQMSEDKKLACPIDLKCYRGTKS